MRRLGLFLILALSAWVGPGLAQPTGVSPVHVTIGAAVTALNGPWRFHTGDDPRWADPAFDDTAWESVDLTPRPGAHDGDVGLSGYVPGWNARGHRGYAGYAWYRLHVALTAPAGAVLALSGPPLVDSAYQIFFNGHPLGGSGRFAGATPVVYGAQPRMFALPAGADGGVVAVRAWAGPGRVAGAPDAGGIHIAPAIGDQAAIHDRFLLQWRQTFLGYVVDLIPAILLGLLAIMAASLCAVDPADRAYAWMVGALLVTAAARFNQVVMFWTQIEDGMTYNIVRRALIEPLALGAWTMAWLEWFRIGRARRFAMAAFVLTAVYSLAFLLGGSWRPSAVPDALGAATHAVIVWVRYGFVALFLLLAVLGAGRERPRPRFDLVAMASVAAILFGPELSLLHVQEIWFPWGVGVSLSEYGCVVLTPFLFATMLGRLLEMTRSLRTRPAGAQPQARAMAGSGQSAKGKN